MNRRVSQIGFFISVVGAAVTAIAGLVPVAGLFSIPMVAFAVDLAIKDLAIKRENSRDADE